MVACHSRRDRSGFVMGFNLFRLVLKADLYPPKPKDQARVSKKFALAVMADHANDSTGREARPSMTTIARECGYATTRQAKRTVHTITKEEWLILDRPATFTMPASYRINLDKLKSVLRKKKRRRGVSPTTPPGVSPATPRTLRLLNHVRRRTPRERCALSHWSPSTREYQQVSTTWEPRLQ